MGVYDAELIKKISFSYQRKTPEKVALRQGVPLYYHNAPAGRSSVPVAAIRQCGLEVRPAAPPAIFFQLCSI